MTTTRPIPERDSDQRCPHDGKRMIHTPDYQWVECWHCGHSERSHVGNREGVCSSCGATIRWARTDLGKWMPLDNEPDPGGLVAYSGYTRAHVLTAGESPATNEKRYRTHFETCPNAEQHRNSR